MSLAGILVLATVPEIFDYSTYGYTNLPLASYLCLGMIIGGAAFQERDRGLHLLTGVLLGSAG